MSGTFFWSDTHFNHANIIELSGRPQMSVEEMNEWLIRMWNERVGEKDDIYLLGDFGFSHSKLPSVAEIFARLNGRKHLVYGNHDEHNPKVMKLPWVTVRGIGTVRLNGMRAEVCHYPLETWKGAHHGAIMLHGHSHGSLKRKLAHRFDVGVDSVVGASGPVKFEALVEMAIKEVFHATDHHGDL